MYGVYVTEVFGMITLCRNHRVYGGVRYGVVYLDPLPPPLFPFNLTVDFRCR
jgi:hypothetical protein